MTLRTLLSLLLLFLCVCPLATAQENKDKPKPEIKGLSSPWLRPGQTVSIVVYGENLAPKEAGFVKGGLTAKVSGTAQPTEGEDKKRGGQRLSVEITVPAACPPDVYELTLTHENNVKPTARLAVLEPAAVELEIKRPCATFAEAMPLLPVQKGVVAVMGALANGDAPDTFRFEAKAGETWEIRLLAGRAGSPMDALARVRDRRHFPLHLSAGDEGKDRVIAFRAPRDDSYYIEVSDAEGRSGPTFVYRLTLRRQP